MAHARLFARLVVGKEGQLPQQQLGFLTTWLTVNRYYHGTMISTCKSRLLDYGV